ncbi:MAG: type IX secretion system sortase PorU [Bacteroidia bacterium]|jgi:hypothetical protein|nr:type IX secretion system sortase PorU [Bacteroidia bacterium]
MQKTASTFLIYLRILLLFALVTNVTAQNLKIPLRINWKQAGGQAPTFDKAVFQNKTAALPWYKFVQPLPGAVNPSVQLTNAQYEPIFDVPADWTSNLSDSISLNWQLLTNKKQNELHLQFIPIRENPQTGKMEKLVTAEILVNYQLIPQSPLVFGKTSYATTSLLATGQWYKISVNQSGVYVLTKAYLKSIGINADAIDPRTIKIYGYSGMLPQRNNAPRFDDLLENAIVVEGESDGVFDENDRVLFYGDAPTQWSYNANTQRYDHVTHLYSDVTCYFLTVGGTQGIRIQQAPVAGTPTATVNQYDHLYVYEKEVYNLIKSGRRWMGEEFNRITNYTFPVNMGTVNTAEPVILVSSVAARSFTPSSFSITQNNQFISNQSVGAVFADYESAYAASSLIATSFNATSGNINLSYTYNIPIPGSLGWLDYFELQSRNLLVQNGGQLLFRDRRSVAPNAIATFDITSQLPLNVWDVTKPHQIKRLNTNFTGSSVQFVASTDSLREYISFTGNQFLTPISMVAMPNQNLHGLPQADVLIITHPQFINESNALANFHRTRSGLSVHVVTPDAIYNEFSSGTQDVSAIRDFVRMFYKKASIPAEMPKYLILFGRASYDYKNRIPNNTNFVPTFQSIESFAPTATYNSDDYFGFLDDNEGKWESAADGKELLDIAIGRLPAQDNTQAQNMLSKITNYVSKPLFGDWKTKLVFVADDEDGNLHQTQANNLANRATNEFKDYNIKKIFIDGYEEENTAGGARNPTAQREIVQSVEQGAMLINYTGHGGEVGWASERILNTDDIQGWTNGLKLPLFVTATCEFSRFDDPARTSAGEMALLNPNGGAIALFTTVRLVFSSANFALNNYLLDNIGLDSASAFDRKRLGEILRLTKNDYISSDKNERNFTLLGDPVIYLAYPSHRVVTTEINNQPVSITPDTLKAFAKVTISGKVTDINNNDLNQFNGIVYPTIYDKTATYRTIGNNLGSLPTQTFTMRNNVIYRGKASVKNGKFTFSFIVPKDIAYEIGLGKISYTADNGLLDGIGRLDNIIVGGTSDSIPIDQAGPDIRLFLNDEKFVFGGITGENPTLLVKLKDEHGVNITGRGVGRDISMVLNNDVTKTVTLNEFYQAKLDNYQEGEVRYKLASLPAGKHTLTVRAFDVYNNSSDALLEFIVASSSEMAIQNILNYPNPFTTQTTFHFDHNKAGEPITVQIQIYTISGKIVKTLQTESISQGNHFDQLTWDGKDEFGDNIGKGVYVYKVKVLSGSGKSAQDFQKLVILN